MTDDLVKRLRCYADLNDAVFHPWVYGEAADRIEKLEAQLAQSQLKRWAARWEEQSDRIEKLEAALQEFIDPCIEHCFDTCQSECDPMKDCPCFKARKALEGKDD